MNETTAPDVSEYSAWPSVADAATALGVSERAIQKRCKAGTMAARLIDTPKGERWAIAPDELTRTKRRTGREPDELRTRTGEPVGREPREMDADLSMNEANEPANLDANRANFGREQDANTGELLAHLQGENAFLRGLIEQRDRDAAELRAALREALKAMPKAITAGEVGSTPNAQNAGIENLTKPNISQSREDATGRDETAPAANMPPKAANVAQRGAQTRGGGLKVLRDGLRAMMGWKE